MTIAINCENCKTNLANVEFPVRAHDKDPTVFTIVGVVGVHKLPTLFVN